MFPGLRLMDDLPRYYDDSMATITAVLQKMPLVGAMDAMFALHPTSELPPANFSDPTAAVRTTMAVLARIAKVCTITTVWCWWWWGGRICVGVSA